MANDKYTGFEDLRKDFDLLSAELLSDILFVSSQAVNNDSQTNRRLYLKSMFSAIEAEMSFLRSHIKATGEVDYLCLSEEEERIVYERPNRKRLSFIQNVVFTIELFSEVNYVFLKLDKKNKSWQLLNKFVKIRNRLTHPRTSQDVLISGQEVKNCELAFNYFNDLISGLMTACAKSLQQHVDILEKQLKAMKNEQGQ